jgi:hypothetical protein
MAIYIASAAVLLVLCIDIGRLALAPTREASIDAVRIRNAMVAELGDPAETDWPPNAPPPNYHLETLPPPAFFMAVVDEVVPPEARQEPALATALRLARHLHSASRPGEPIQSDTQDTYEKILTGQGGYCADYTQVFDALALAAGLQVREWGFTWEDMANGHAFNEVWDPELSKWVLVDVFNSFYVVDADTGVPMGALEFRASLLKEAGSGEAQLVPIVADRFGFKSSEKALNWFFRGVPRMYLLLGNNVVSYDANPAIQLTEVLPRSVEMMVAILIGKHPRFLFVPPASHPEVRDQVEQLHEQLLWFLVKIAVIFVLGIGLLTSGWRSLRARRSSDRAAA